MALPLSPAGQGQVELPFCVAPTGARSDLRASLMATMDHGERSVWVGFPA